MNCTDLIRLLEKWDEWSNGVYLSLGMCHGKCPMGPLCCEIGTRNGVPCWTVLLLGHLTGVINLDKGPPNNAVCKRDSDAGV